jgi:murein DD-endopeptidase MepM/ murein hydrolase activator NlpD
VVAPYDGTIYGYGTSITPATGRWVGIDFANGQRFRAMHHSRLLRTSGKVFKGETIIALSGASGYGKEDWSGDPNTGGAHTHATLWPTWETKFGYHWVNGKKVPYTIDFMEYADLSGVAGGGGIPFPTTQQGDEMIAVKSPGRKPVALDGAGSTPLNDEEFSNFLGPKFEVNDRQFDLAVSVYARLTPWIDPRDCFLGKGQSADRPWTLMAPGYVKTLTAEEVGNMPFTTRRVEGNDRQFDLWVSEAISGSGFPVNVTITDDDDNVVIPTYDYDKAARTTRDLFAAEPLK